MTVHERSSGQPATYRQGEWEIGQLRGSSLIVGGQQVIGGRGAAIGSPSGGSIIDAEARSAVALILGAMRLHGLIET